MNVNREGDYLTLEELEDVGEDADAEGQVDGPRTEVEEAGEQHQRTETVRLREQNLSFPLSTIQRRRRRNDNY